MPPFNLFFVGLGWSFAVGESVGFIIMFTCFPTQQKLVNRNYPNEMGGGRVSTSMCTGRSTAPPPASCRLEPSRDAEEEERAVNGHKYGAGRGAQRTKIREERGRELNDHQNKRRRGRDSNSHHFLKGERCQRSHLRGEGGGLNGYLSG